VLFSYFKYEARNCMYGKLCGGLPSRNFGGLAKRPFKVSLLQGATTLEHMAFDDLGLSPCYETLSPQID
jgi:hypothetical protein